MDPEEDELDGPRTLVDSAIRGSLNAIPSLLSAEVREKRATGSISREAFLRTVSSDEKLLLAGGFSSRASSSQNAPSQRQCSEEHRQSSKSSVVPPSSVDGEKFLPRQCLFLEGQPSRQPRRLGGQRLVPAAARLRSHNSWTNFLPTRTPEPPGASGRIIADAKADSCADVAAKSEAPCLEPGAKQGPKFRVQPGGSRPLKQDFLVLEFRSEPRVVPAGRKAAKRSEASSKLDPPDAGKSLADPKFSPFRQGSRQWAADREALVASWRD